MRHALPLALLGFLVSVAVWSQIPAMLIAPRWTVLSVGIPLYVIVLITHGRLRFTADFGWIVLFLGYAALSILWSEIKVAAVDELWRWCVLAGAFTIGASVETLDPLYRGLWLGLVVNAVVVVGQFIGAPPVIWAAPAMAMGAGLFGNKNFLAELAGLITVGLAGSWLMILPLGLVVADRCFEVAAALLSVASIWLFGTRRIAALAAVATALPLGAALALGAFGTVSHLHTIQHRLALWTDVVEDLTLFGHGAGSYYTAIAAHSDHQRAFGPNRENHAHSDGLELVYELGLPGALFMVALLARCFASFDRRNRFVLATFLIEACFGMPLHLPATAFVAACVCGHLSRARRHLQPDLAAGRSVGDRGAAAARPVAPRSGRSRRGRETIPA